jgi:hypothetical protein
LAIVLRAQPSANLSALTNRAECSKKKPASQEAGYGCDAEVQPGLRSGTGPEGAVLNAGQNS